MKHIIDQSKSLWTEGVVILSLIEARTLLRITGGAIVRDNRLCGLRTEPDGSDRYRIMVQERAA